MNKVLVPLVLAVAWLTIGWRASVLRAERPAAPPPEPIDAFMVYSAREAVDIAADMGIALDYSDASVKKVDEALEKIRQEYLQRKSEEGLWGLSVIFGAYVGEMMRRRDSTFYWKKDHPKIGENTFPLFLGSGDDCVFPVGWCQKRILNGEEDNVEIKLRFFRSKRTGD